MYTFPSLLYTTLFSKASSSSFLTSTRISAQLLYSPELSQFLGRILRGRQHTTLTCLLTQPETILLERQQFQQFLERIQRSTNFTSKNQVFIVYSNTFCTQRSPTRGILPFLSCQSYSKNLQLGDGGWFCVFLFVCFKYILTSVFWILIQWLFQFL